VSAVEEKAPIVEEKAPAAVLKPKEFVIYSDKGSRENHYIPSGWMGDFGDIKLNDQFMENPHSGTSSIQLVYTAKKSRGQGWAGIFWQNPAQNWGDKKGGYDLTGMTKLTIWARGQKGGEIVKFKVGGIGVGQSKPYPDTATIETDPIELTDAWKQYTMNLSGKDLSYISGGFCWTAEANQNPEGATFYLDDIKFEADANMKPEGKKKEDMPFYVYSDSRSAKNHFVPSGWMPGSGTGQDIKYDNSNKEDPYLGDTCIKIQYKDVSGNRWAGIYWLHASTPVDDWGKYDVGYDLSKATKVTFWARGAKGGERIETFKVGGVMAGPYADSDASEIGPVILTKEWTQYTIDLKGKDASYINGGFCWATNMDVQKEESMQEATVTFYLDEIKYE